MIRIEQEQKNLKAVFSAPFFIVHVFPFLTYLLRNPG